MKIFSERVKMEGKVLVFFCLFVILAKAQQPLESDEECPDLHYNKDVNMANDKVNNSYFQNF